MRKLELNEVRLLSLGMDGSNLDMSFEKKLATELEELKSTSFISIGSCALHTVSNGFGERMRSLRSVIDLDQFAINLHFFLNTCPQEERNGIECVRLGTPLAGGLRSQKGLRPFNPLQNQE